MTQWKYYNHAIIPDQAPHLPVETSKIDDGSIFDDKMGSSRAMLARWTEGWDLPQKTHWWYIICKSPFKVEALSKNSRKNIRSSLRKCVVCLINPQDYADDLWRVYNEAALRYKTFYNRVNKETFMQELLSDNREYWGGFIAGTSQLIGYKIVTVNQEYAEFNVSKYSTPYLKLRVSDALDYTCLDYYLNQQHKTYVLSGSRTVSHITNVQNYNIEHFNFKKAYCKLHIKYRPDFEIFIKFLYPFRKFLKYIDFCGPVHHLYAVLQMEEICRADKGVTCTD